MTIKTTAVTPKSINLGLGAIFDAMSGEFVDAVINRATESWKMAPADIRKSFEQMVRGSGISIPGFRVNVPGSKLPGSKSARLRNVVGQCAFASDEGAGVVLKTWAAAIPTLHSTVVDYLQASLVDTEYPDFITHEFRGQWQDDTWLRARDALSATTTDCSRDDVALMVCYVAGLIPSGPLDADLQPVSTMGEPQFGPILDKLRALKVGDREWNHTLDFIAGAEDFVIQANDIVAARVAEATVGFRASLSALISAIADEFDRELVFLEVDTDSWSPAALTTIDQLFRATDLMDTLKSELTDYQPIHPQAPTKTEEMDRAEDRQDYQEAILETVASCETLFATTTQPVASKLDSDQLGDSDGHVLANSEVPDSTETPFNGSTNGPITTDATDARTAFDIDGRDNPLSDKVAEVRFLRQKLKDLREQYRREIRDRRQTTAQSNRAALEGRRLPRYRPSVRLDDFDDSQRFESVAEVVETAQTDLESQIILALNSHAIVDGNPFEPADEVWDALTWLATVYRETCTGREREPDLDHSIRGAVGWTYAPHQSDEVMNKYPVAYSARFNDREYDLGAHIRKGSDRDARHTIRIAFAWDSDLEKVIVGYIGPHQPTRRS